MSRKVKGGRVNITSRSNPFVSVIEIDDESGESASISVWLSEDESESASSVECWAGHLHARDISNWADKTRMNSEQYLKETVSALTGERDYILELNEEEAELRWKKRITQDGIVLKMGSVRMRRRKSSAEALSACVGRLKGLEEEVGEARGRCEGLEAERAALAEKLEQCCVKQRRLETELYTKFALVLNEKKKKIEELQNASPAPPAETKAEVTKKSAPAARKKKAKKVDEFSLEAEASSDDADLQPIVARKRNLRARKLPEVPSTSKAKPEEEEDAYGGETQPMDTQELLDDF